MTATPFVMDALAFEGLVRVIDYLLPPGGPFPPVRQVVRREDAAVSIGAIPDGDRKTLMTIFRVLRWMPRWGLVVPFVLTRALGRVPGAVGSPFRLLTFGFEGLAYTLYFSTPAVLSVLRWDADIRSEHPVGGGQ